MNLAAYLSGTVDVLRGGVAWPNRFDLTRRGFQQSFIALVLSVPALFTAALGIATQRAEILGGEPAAIPVAAFGIIAGLYLLSFSATAYMITMFFDRQDRFRPWVITRHWAVFFMSLLVAVGFGTYLLGWLPFAVANAVAFIVFMAVLAVDIVLAIRVANFRWGAAIYAACAIAAMGLCVLLFGTAQFSA